jgi:ribose transport system ATP-binding protein
MSSEAPRLEVRSLSKTFGTVQVLTDVELTVAAGEVHGLAGQNGSGKSTLIKIVTGLYTPDPGAEYRVDGAPMRLPVRWPEVHAAGVSVVHQDLGLLDQLTVAENICVGGFPTTGLISHIDRKQRDWLAARTLERLGAEIEPSALVGSLSAAERAEVAIARAMRDHAAGTGLIILDESTRALSGDDLVRMHAMLRRVTADGSAALMVSHNLTELMAVTDRMTILRDGLLAGAGLPTQDLSEADIARRMLGGQLEETRAGATGLGGPRRPPSLFRRCRGVEPATLSSTSRPEKSLASPVCPATAMRRSRTCSPERRRRPQALFGPSRTRLTSPGLA